MFENTKIMRMLLDCNCDHSFVDDMGCTALHYSVLSPGRDAFNLLIEKGVSVNIIDQVFII